MVTERVVSLAPSATAILGALDALDAAAGPPGRESADESTATDAPLVADTLVGVTHACTPPAGASPTVVGGWPNPDLDAVERLDPTVVLTCDPLQRETADALRDRGLVVEHAEPTRLADVYAYVADVGAAVGRPGAGDRLAGDLRDRVDRVRAAVPGDPAERPVVYAEEWGDPPMAAGNWVPDAVAAAGGRCPFVPAGERSHEVDPSAVERADPDHAVLHWCGTNRSPGADTLADRDWDVDPAVHVIDDSLLNQPSPRLVDGIETLAELFHGVNVSEK
ncbi:helical backbone metal receptor [Halobaculum roseum]|uniref:Helical backbone metal receptor n=1 Tax=Halobaculum roseum TaxID=2175149 RepID=A0ABD5MN90_9EURY|nr:helical backbone metal receptor [Halobaculum roseum]QZY02410.1 helical backbone metal receptor [Halobaculum roseum]